MSVIPHLPQELIDAVIERLSQRCDRRTLTACALVSKSFSMPARRRLFSVVEISQTFASSQTPLRRMQTMAEFLSNEASDLVFQIQELRVEVSTDEILEINPGLDSVLERIIAHGSKVSSVSFGGTWLHIVSWTSLRHDTARLLTQLFALDRIKRIRLAYLAQVPTTLITDRSYLQFLESTNTSFAEALSPTTREIDVRTQTRVEHLDVFPSLAAFNLALGPAITLKGRLDTYLGRPEDVSAFLEMIKRISGSLTSVSLLLNDFETFLENFLEEATHPLPILSVKDVTFICGPVFYSSLPALNPIIALFAHAVESPKVENVTIRFMVATTDEYIRTFLPSRDLGLEYLGSAIIQNEYSNLKSIIFELFISLQVLDGGRGAWHCDSAGVERIRKHTEKVLTEDMASLFIPAGTTLSMDVTHIAARVKATAHITISK